MADLGHRHATGGGLHLCQQLGVLPQIDLLIRDFRIIQRRLGLHKDSDAECIARLGSALACQRFVSLQADSQSRDKHVKLGPSELAVVLKDRCRRHWRTPTWPQNWQPEVVMSATGSCRAAWLLATESACCRLLIARTAKPPVCIPLALFSFMVCELKYSLGGRLMPPLGRLAEPALAAKSGPA